jgi:hypothetical protein
VSTIAHEAKPGDVVLVITPRSVADGPGAPHRRRDRGGHRRYAPRVPSLALGDRCNVVCGNEDLRTRMPRGIRVELKDSAKSTCPGAGFSQRDAPATKRFVVAESS